jgi:ribosome-binding factor A
VCSARPSATLTFVADALPDTAKTIEDLLDKARASDEKVREVSAGASFAGDADPYKKPGEDDEDDEDEDDSAR